MHIIQFWSNFQLKTVQAHIASNSRHVINQKYPFSSQLFNRLEIVEQHIRA